ncbi:hypothetical protein BSPWISOXPB_4738 [uncultured Gammaproteobacteria bacterium]|nr:hypothetical protein BSPWISOXPB_4738 [uncultured Gammaproteobacteria bacterium]
MLLMASNLKDSKKYLNDSTEFSATIAFAFVGGVAISGAKLVLPTLRSVYYGYAHHMQKVLDFIEGVAILVSHLLVEQEQLVMCFLEKYMIQLSIQNDRFLKRNWFPFLWVVGSIYSFNGYGAYGWNLIGIQNILLDQWSYL